MYISEPITSKQAFREAVADGESISIVREVGSPVTVDDGICTVSAQHPLKWRARVRIESGVVVEVLN